MPYQLSFFMVLLAAGFCPAYAAEMHKRLTRGQSFLGIHYDFHAAQDCTEIGKNTTRAMIENIINQVHPDYIQIDCKGHPGLSSYPTKVGNQAPGFVGDPLRVWRQVTAEHGVSLYMHYSGVWDSQAVKLHPDWAAVDAAGNPSDKVTSLFGPYVDKLLIPQLRELAGEYGVDGAWVDGECWAAVPDYSKAALDAFVQATGIKDVPRTPQDPHWHEFLDFNREQFRRYLRQYLAEVKKTNPGFQICSNWAFSDHMAEPVSAPMDFLSGDYAPEDSVNSARLSARYLAEQGVSWDLMAWSFSNVPGTQTGVQKSVPQLSREAAVVLAAGGGFQAYFKQKGDGSVSDDQVPLMAEVAKFCRARQAISHHAKAVPQVALLLSTAGHYRKINGLFPRDLSNVHAVLQALLEGQQSVQILSEHHLLGRMTDYPLIVVPEWAYLAPEFKTQLISYANAGGKLLLVGPDTASLFQDSLGATLAEKPATEPMQLVHGDQAVPLQGPVRPFTLGATARPFGALRLTDPASSPLPAACITPLGKGQVAATCFTFSQSYLPGRSPAARQFLIAMVRELFPEPMVQVQGSNDVDVTVARNQGKLLVHLVNTAGPHQTEPTFSSIPPIGPLTVTIRTSVRPAAVTLQPANQPLAFEFSSGQVRVTVPKVEIHQIVVVE